VDFFERPNFEGYMELLGVLGALDFEEDEERTGDCEVSRGIEGTAKDGFSVVRQVDVIEEGAKL